MTALIVVIVVLFAVFALFIAWWDLRGWLHDVDLELDEDALRLTEREWDQIQHAHDYPPTPRRINGDTHQGDSR